MYIVHCTTEPFIVHGYIVHRTTDVDLPGQPGRRTIGLLSNRCQAAEVRSFASNWSTPVVVGC